MLNPYQNLLMNYPTGDSELERFRRAQQNAQMMAAKQIATSVPQPEPPSAVLSEEQKRLLSGGVRTPMPAVSDFAETNPPAPPSPPPAVAAVPAQPAQGAGGPVPFQPQLEYPAATLDKGPSTKANMQATRPNNMDAGQQRGYEGGQPSQNQMAAPQDIVPAAIDNVQRDPSFLDKARGWMDQLGSYFDPAGQGGDPNALHPAYGVPNAKVWEAQRGVLFNAGIMLMAAGMPNSPENRAAIIASMGNALNQTADQVIRVASASTGGAKTSNWYRMYQEAGGEQGTGMSFNDWMLEMRKSSTNPKGESAYDQQIGKGLGEAMNTIQTEARNALSANQNLDAMENLLQDPNIYTGFGGETALQLKRGLAAMGVQGAEGVDSMESFRALANRSALDTMGGSLGAGFSNADRDFVTGMTVSLNNTPDGNRQLIEIMRKLNDRKVDLARMAREYAAQNNGRIDYGFDEMIARYAVENPLFPPMPQQPRPAPGGSTPTRPRVLSVE